MRARHLIDHASFGPDALKVIGDAFDAAWAEIAGWFGADPLLIEAARLRLADAVLSVASEHGHEVEALKRAALQRMEQLHQTTSRWQRQHGIPQGVLIAKATARWFASAGDDRYRRRAVGRSSGT